MGTDGTDKALRGAGKSHQEVVTAGGELVPLIYDELRSLARGYMRRQPADHTLQPTALVHEAYMRMAGEPDDRWSSKRHFMAVAAKAMRQLLVDHARRRGAGKRGGAWKRITLHDGVGPQGRSVVDLIDLSDALDRLERLHDRQARIIELRFFAGQTIAETAKTLGVGTTTVEDDFAMAKAWLARELAGE